MPGRVPCGLRLASCLCRARLADDSGRYYDLITDFVTPQLQPANDPNNPEPTQTAFAIGLQQQHAPGTVDQYNQMGFQVRPWQRDSTALPPTTHTHPS